MADNFPLTPGAGRNAATDQVTYSGDQADVQIVRIVQVTGSEGSKTVVDLPGDATNGLDVDVTRIAAGENHLGEIGGKSVVISASVTRPANTTAYAAGDAVTDSTTAPNVITFSGAGRINGGSGVILAASLIDSANQTTKGQFELWLFDATATPDNDNSAFTPTDTETETLIGVIPFNVAYVGDATSGAGGNAVYPVQGLSIPFKCGGATTNIFGLVVVRNAYTPVSAEKFTVRLHILQD